MTKFKDFTTAKDLGFVIPPYVDESAHERSSCIVIRGNIPPIDDPDTIYDHKVSSPDPIERVLHEVKDRFADQYGISVTYWVDRKKDKAGDMIGISLYLSWTGDLEKIDRDKNEILDMLYHGWVSRFRSEAVQALNKFFDENYTPIEKVASEWVKLAEKTKATKANKAKK